MPWPSLLMIVVATVFYFLPLYRLRRQSGWGMWDVVFLVAATLEAMFLILLSFASFYSAHGIISTYHVGADGKIDNTPVITHDRQECLYFSAITWTTVGYGDFLPTPGACRFAAASEALLEYVFLGAFLAVLMEVTKEIRSRNPPR